MIRKLIAAIAVTVCCMGNPLPAQAEYTTCWFDQGDGAETLSSQPCDLVVKTEGDTKFVHIYTPSDNGSIKLALFFLNEKPAYVELYDPSTGKKQGVMFFRIDDDGSVHVYNSDYEFYFAWPKETNHRPAPGTVFSEKGITA